MEYSSDLAYKILLYLEANDVSETKGEVLIDGYSQEEISYHIKKLTEERLVEGKDASTFGGLHWLAVDLTSSGHKQLDEQRKGKLEFQRNELLTLPQKLWLEAIWAKQENGQDINGRRLKVELQGRLPSNFNPSEINSLLLRSNIDITLFGIGLIAPESEIIKKTNQIIQSIQKILRGNPNTQIIFASTVSKLAGLEYSEVEDIFEKLSDVGLFHNHGIKGTYGLQEITIDEKAFDNYLKYKSISEWLEYKAKEIHSTKLIVSPVISNIENLIPQVSSMTNQQNKADSRTVFVVHGRNSKARKALFQFLRSIGLHPLEWSQAVELTGKASPYVGEVLEAAFSAAQAVVILFTPDDEARLREEYRGTNEPDYETQLTGQARPNVIFEAGMAMGMHPDRTVLVELGDLRPISDISGRHVIRLSNSAPRRQELAQRLKTAGCSVNLIGTDWHDEGNFDIPTNRSIEVSVQTIAASVEKLSEECIKILKVLNELSDGSDGAVPRFIAEHIQLDIPKTKYFLDLLEEREMISYVVDMDYGTQYHINRKGRKYLFENT